MSRMTEKLESLADAQHEKLNNHNHLSIKELNEWHLRVLDYMLMKPNITNKELAELLDVSALTVAKLRRTPIFRQAWDELRSSVREEVRDELMWDYKQTTKDILASLSMIVQDSEVAPKDKIAAAELVLNGDAFHMFKDKGNSGGGSVSVSVNNNTAPINAASMGVTKEMLEESRKRRLSRFEEGEVVNGEISGEANGN